MLTSAYLVSVFVSVSPAPAQLTLPIITEDRTAAAADRYETCLAEAESRPINTEREARAWELEGGGNPARHCLAAALFRQGEYEEAGWRFRSLATELAERDPILAAPLAAQSGAAWLAAEDHDRAIEALDQAIGWDGAQPGYYVTRARARAALFDYGGAAADLEEAVSLAPENPDARLLAAAAYRRMGLLPEASAAIESALELAPEVPALLLERGNIRLLGGDADGARSDWRQVMNSAPESPAADAAATNLERLAASGR